MPRKTLLILTLFFLLTSLGLNIAYAELSQTTSLLRSNYNADTAWRQTCENEKYIAFISYSGKSIYVDIFDKTLNSFIYENKYIGDLYASYSQYISCYINQSSLYIVATSASAYPVTADVYYFNIISGVSNQIYRNQLASVGWIVGGTAADFYDNKVYILAFGGGNSRILVYDGSLVIRDGPSFPSGNASGVRIRYIPAASAVFSVSQFGSTIYYHLVYANGGGELLAIHTVDNDFSPADVRDIQVVYRDGYWYIVITAVKPRAVNNVRDYLVVVHKLVFNNTISSTNLVAQYRAVAAPSPNLPAGSTPTWAIFSRLSDEAFTVRTPLLDSNVYRIAAFTLRADKLFSPEPHSILLESFDKEDWGWNYYVDSYVYKNQWSSYLVEVLRSSGLALIYRNAPKHERVYVTDNTAWTGNDVLPYNIPLTINISIRGETGTRIDGAVLEVFVDDKQVAANVSKNGEVTATFMIPEGTAATVSYRVKYSNMIIYQFSKDYELREGNWTLKFILIEGSKYNPKQTEYDFSKDVDYIDIDKSYIIIAKLWAEGIPVRASFKIYLYYNDMWNLVGEGVSGPDYLYRGGLSVTLSTVRMRIEAYYNNVKVAEAEKTYPTTYMPPAVSPGAGVSPWTIQSLINVIPALVIALIPPAAFYSVMKNKFAVLLGLGVGVAIGTLAGLIPFAIMLFLALVIVVYFVKSGESG